MWLVLSQWTQLSHEIRSVHWYEKCPLIWQLDEIVKWTLLLGSMFVSVDGGNIGNVFSLTNILGKSLTKMKRAKITGWCGWDLLNDNQPFCNQIVS